MAKPAERTVMTDHAELLLRRVHPTQIKDGRPSKTTFLPRELDLGMLSVDRAAVVTPQDCYAAYAAAKNFAAPKHGGIWAVTVGECWNTGLTSLADPLAGSEPAGPNPAHALIDMHKLNEEALHTAAATLFAAAKARGQLAP